jgi:hypothetical protein
MTKTQAGESATRNAETKPEKEKQMTTPATMTDIATIDRELNDLILSGNALEAFEKFYADDIVMSDNDDEPWIGKDFNRKREQDFFASVSQVHELSLVASAAGEGISFSEWSYDLTFTNGGRLKWNQATVRRWNDGKVVSERFYHKTLG